MVTRNTSTSTGGRASKPATVKMIRPEDQQPKLCVAEVDEPRIREFEDAGWVQKTDAEIAEIEQARAPNPAEEAAPAADAAAQPATQPVAEA